MPKLLNGGKRLLHGLLTGIHQAKLLLVNVLLAGLIAMYEAGASIRNRLDHELLLLRRERQDIFFHETVHRGSSLPGREPGSVTGALELSLRRSEEIHELANSIMIVGALKDGHGAAPSEHGVFRTNRKQYNIPVKLDIV